jgi:hypothetical protein
MQIYHGDVDNILNINSYNESIKEWSGVFGYPSTPSNALNNNPGSRLTKYIYGDRLQGIWGHGFGHVVPTNETEALQWFGILVSLKSCPQALPLMRVGFLVDTVSATDDYSSANLNKNKHKRKTNIYERWRCQLRNKMGPVRRTGMVRSNML